MSAMSGNGVVKTARDQELDFHVLLGELEQDGALSRQAGDDARSRIRPRDLREQHPVQWLGAQNYTRPGDGGKLSEEALMQWVADRHGMEYRRIDPLKVNVPAVTATMAFTFAQRHRILPLEAGAQRVLIATAQPRVRAWVEGLSHVLQKPIELVLAAPSDIERYTLEFFTLARSVQRAGQAESSSGLGNLEQLVKLGDAGKLDANDSHIVNIVDWLLQYAFEQRASDIHLEPRRDTGNVRFRIDGNLHQVYEIPAPVMAAVTSRLKALGRMDVIERRRPQDGRLKTKTPKGREVELRLSTLPTAFGEKMVLRIFDPEVLVKSFQELGLTEGHVAAWGDLVAEPHGLILVTGPTGTGKTTTLYSTLKALAKPEVNVCTVEDPIEMIEPAFNQMQADTKLNLGFADGLRSLLRQDPDIIMVGEIRDLETAEMTLQAALTGHLVFSTLHTNSAAAAVTRLMEIGVPAYLLRAALLGVLAQRLIRTLCPHCKQPGPVGESAWSELTAGWKLELPTSSFVAKGCIECRNTGYSGRVGVYELLTLTPAMASLITPQVETAALHLAAQKAGMRPLAIGGALKVAAGLTTVEEVLSAISARG